MAHNSIALDIAKEFSTAPGPRYIASGKHSAEEFRVSLLIPKWVQAIDEGRKLRVILDGTAGYARSFIDEAFGGAVAHCDREFDTMVESLEIESSEEPELIREIREAMAEAYSKKMAGRKFRQ